MLESSNFIVAAGPMDFLPQLVVRLQASRYRLALAAKIPLIHPLALPSMIERE